MANTNFHLNDEIFEEILNGIPSDNLSIDEKIEREKNPKTHLSSDNKLRLNRVVGAFLQDEKSKSLFYSLIKNVKRREKNKWITQIESKMFLINQAEEEDEEDELIEEISDEKESKGLFKTTSDLKKKYSQYKSLYDKRKKISRAVSNIKQVYGLLSKTTSDTLFSSRRKLLMEMNRYSFDVFDVLKTKYISPMLFSSGYSLKTITDIMTKEIKSKVNMYFQFLEEIMYEILESEIVLILEQIPFIKAILKGGGLITEIWKGKKNADRLQLFFNILQNADKVKYLGSAGWFFVAGEFLQSDKEAINRFGEKIVEDVRAKGREITNTLSQTIGGDINSFFNIKNLIVDSGFVAGEARDLISSKYKDLNSFLIDDIDKKLSIQEKFELVYDIITTSYVKKTEQNWWTRATSYMIGLVNHSINNFNPFLNTLLSINSENEHFINGSGDIISVEKYLSSILDKGIDIIKPNGEKLYLRRRKKISFSEKDEVIKTNKFNPLKISVYTVSNIKNTIDVSAQIVQSQNSGIYPSPNKTKYVVNRDDISDKQFKPVIKISGNKGKFKTITTFYRERRVTKNDQGISSETYYIQNGKSIPISSQDDLIYDSTNEKYMPPKSWLIKLNDKKLSKLGKFFEMLFGTYEIKGSIFNNLNFNYNSSYNDVDYMKYVTINDATNWFDTSKNFNTSITKDRELMNYDFKLFGVNESETLSNVTWLQLLNAEYFMESFMMHRFEKMKENYTLTYNFLKKELDIFK